MQDDIKLRSDNEEAYDVFKKTIIPKLNYTLPQNDPTVDEVMKTLHNSEYYDKI